jgi:hypothetical protein
MSINQIRTLVNELDLTRARNHGRRRSISLEEVFSYESLRYTHPTSVEVEMLGDDDELHPDAQDIRWSINEIAHAVMDDPLNSYLMRLSRAGFLRRHEKNVSSLTRELALYEVTLEDHEVVLMRDPAIQEEERVALRKMEAAKAEYALKREAAVNSRESKAEGVVLIESRRRQLSGDSRLCSLMFGLNTAPVQHFPYGSHPILNGIALTRMELEDVRDDLSVTTVATIMALNQNACLIRLNILHHKGYETNQAFRGLWAIPPVGNPDQWILKYGPSPLFDARTADVAQLQDRLLDYLGFTDDERDPIDN